MNERVLVVDDERDSADTLALLINALGCEARAVYDGAQAIEEIVGFDPDMMLVDVGMPGLSGYETVARIRQQRKCDHLILVAVTCWSRDEDKQRAYECGFDLHFTKPMDANVLKELLALLGPAAAAKSRKDYDEIALRELQALLWLVRLKRS